jgi:hypothetical protein
VRQFTLARPAHLLAGGGAAKDLHVPVGSRVRYALGDVGSSLMGGARKRRGCLLGSSDSSYCFFTPVVRFAFCGYCSGWREGWDLTF